MSNRSYLSSDRAAVTRHDRSFPSAVVEMLEPRRLLSAGDLDAFYGNGGIASIMGGTVAKAVVSLPDGRAYVAGGGLQDVTLARVWFDGAPDRTFGTDGVVRTDVLGGSDEVAQAMVVQPDAKIVVASWCRAPGQTFDFALLRYLPDGTLDPAFGSGGVATLDFGGTNDFVTDVLLQGDGKLVAIGSSSNGNKSRGAAARFGADGSMDSSFGTEGKLIVDLSPGFGGIGGSFDSGLLLADGRILLTGVAAYDQTWESNKLVLAVYDADGQPDAGSSADGIKRFVTPYVFGSAVTPAPDGGYLVTAANTGAVGILKFTGAGTLDTGWGTDGATRVYSSSANSVLVNDGGAIAVQTDGSVLTSYGSDGGWVLARVLPGGQLDGSFGGGVGYVRQYLGTYGEGGSSLSLQPDGSVLVVGGRVTYPIPIAQGLLIGRYRGMPDPPPGGYLDAPTGTLTIFGDAGANELEVSVDPTAGVLNVTLDGLIQQFPSSHVTRVDLRLLGGDDVAHISSGIPGGVADLGSGNDTLAMTGLDLVPRRKVFGGTGDDTVELRAGMGATVEVDGAAGTDTLRLTGTNGDDVLTLHRNTATGFGYAATYSATEKLLADALGGSDSVTLNATTPAAATILGGDGSDWFLLLAAETDPWGTRLPGFPPSINGGAGDDALEYSGSESADTLRLQSTSLTHDAYTAAAVVELEEITLRGGGGNDLIVSASGALARLIADGGAGVDRLAFEGTHAADTIIINPSTIAGAGKVAEYDGTVESVLVSGLGGDDGLYGGDGADVLLGGDGDDLIDGGGGDDLLDAGSGSDSLYGGDGVDHAMVPASAANDIITVGPDYVLINAGTSSFREIHYAGDVEFLTVDADSGVDSASAAGTIATDLTLLRLEPTVSAGDDVTTASGKPFTGSGSFHDLADPGAAVNGWTATVDYGDRTGPRPLTVDYVNRSFNLSHTYVRPGVYTVIVRVTDSQGNVGTDSLRVTVPVPATVTDVFVASSAWTTTFHDFLNTTGQGDGTFGYRLTHALHADELPWINLNKLSIRFSQHVNIAAGALRVFGVNVLEYAGSVAYDPATFTATFQLTPGTVFAADKLLVHLDDVLVTDAAGATLDGEWTNPAETTPVTSGGADTYPSGNGTAGGDFGMRINVLPGDVTRDGEIVGNDVTNVRFNQGFMPGQSGYSIFRDVTGDGEIIGNDVTGVRFRQGIVLPAGTPIVPTPAVRNSLWEKGSRNDFPSRTLPKAWEALMRRPSWKLVLPLDAAEKTDELLSK